MSAHSFPMSNLIWKMCLILEKKKKKEKSLPLDFLQDLGTIDCAQYAQQCAENIILPWMSALKDGHMW